MEWINHPNKFALCNRQKSGNIYPTREAAWGSLDETGCPDWPGSIAAAWELVEEMADDGDLFIEYWQDGEWFSANHPVGIHPRELGHCDGRETGNRNICRAICLAWLEWHKQQSK